MSAQIGLGRTVLLGAMAGALGWGIRGQYGHGTGAMIAGVLVGLVLVLTAIPDATSLRGARAVALLALGISFGGSMTYGQTIGLTQDAIYVGNWAAFRWGMLGLFLKGGIWFGLAGLFLGIALGGKRWRTVEMAILPLAMLGLMVLGQRALNQPFDPRHRILPHFYFSADWYWQPGAKLKPRPEDWGGLLFVLAGLICYSQVVHRDRLARNMALAGILAGGLGFPLGQCVQAFHAWNPATFQSGALRAIDPNINWWNMMETTFGAIGGGGLALGLWRNRRLIPADSAQESVVIAPPWELIMVAAYVYLLVGAEFHLVPRPPRYLRSGSIMTGLALAGIVGGRYWPYLFALPIVALPIAGKTLISLSYKDPLVSPSLGWSLLVALPLGLALAAALLLARRGRGGEPASRFAAAGLLLTTWLYFSLNFTFFRFPWPWAAWTYRTPNALIFTACALGLTTAAVGLGSRKSNIKE